MKSGSLTVNAASIDSLTNALKSEYGECSEIISKSGDTRLIAIEKYYFRVNSNSMGVVLIETIGEGKFLVHIIAGGAKAGMLGLDYGAENQFVDEIENILHDVEDETAAEEERQEQKAKPSAPQTCIVCHSTLNKGEMLLKCPSCGGIAHRAHILEWLHTKDYCPSCHAHITQHALIPMVERK